MLDTYDPTAWYWLADDGRLYFSAEGENDVDIFRVDRVEE